MGLNFLRLLFLISLDETLTLSFLIRATRPYFMLWRGRGLKHIYKSVLRSLPKMMYLVWIIGLVVTSFGLVGYALFNKISHTYFNTLEESLMSLLILLTTANYSNCSVYEMFFKK